MRDMLIQALAPVLRDVQVTGAPIPTIADEPLNPNDLDTASAMMFGENGAGVSFVVSVSQLHQARVRTIALDMQSFILGLSERSAGAATNWPRCPSHREAHSLQVAVVEGIASWTCPDDARLLYPVGSLPTSAPPTRPS
jgi:hypothetical protein